jgi:hypothetical protein
MEWRALVDPCSAYESPQSGYLGADMASPLLRDTADDWLDADSWKEKELEVDIRMNDMYMNKK